MYAISNLLWEEDGLVQIYRRRNRPNDAMDPGTKGPVLQETELVLKLKKRELFDPYILLPHAELNGIVYHSVDTFVEKYKGTDMTLFICTEPINPQTQNVFGEVYRSHYRDKLLKVNQYLRRYYIRALILILVSVCAFLVSRFLTRFNPNETILSYIILNVSAFCIWEVGYTHFSTRNVIEEKKRIIRALHARIEFQ